MRAKSGQLTLGGAVAKACVSLFAALNTPGARRLSAVLLLAGLMLRGLVAPGYMLDRSPERGAVTIRICGGGVPQTMSLALAQMPGEGGGSMPAGGHSHNVPTTDHFCPFAAAAASAPLPGQVAVLAPLLQPRMVSRPLPALMLVHPGPVDGPLSARGPPALI